MAEMADEHRDNMWCEDEVNLDKILFNKCIYFAHPRSTYMTELEIHAVANIEIAFDAIVINPSEGIIDYDAAIANSDMVVFMADNNILGKGTVSNVSLAHSLGIPVYYYEDKTFYQGGTMRLINGGRDWSRYATIVTRGEVYKSLKPRLTWFDKLNTWLLQWRRRLERRVNHAE